MGVEPLGQLIVLSFIGTVCHHGPVRWMLHTSYIGGTRIKYSRAVPAGLFAGQKITSVPLREMLCHTVIPEILPIPGSELSVPTGATEPPAPLLDKAICTSFDQYELFAETL